MFRMWMLLFFMSFPLWAKEHPIRYIEPTDAGHKILNAPMEFPKEDLLEDALFKVVKGSSTHLESVDPEHTQNTYSISPWETVLNQSPYFQDTPIRISDENLDAENVFYHLHQAHKQFLNLLGNEFIGLNHPKLTIRVQMDSDYHQYLKFTKTMMGQPIPEEMLYNNAKTIRDPDSKKLEIWFYPPKAFRRTWLLKYIPNPARFNIFTKNTMLGTKIGELDTAKIRDIIYHEYAHVILEPLLGVGHPTPLREALADFLAAFVLEETIVGDMSSFNSDWFFGPYTKYAKNLKDGASIPYTKALEQDVQFGREFVSNLLFETSALLPKSLMKSILKDTLTCLNGKAHIHELSDCLIDSLFSVDKYLSTLVLKEVYAKHEGLRERYFVPRGLDIAYDPKEVKLFSTLQDFYPYDDVPLPTIRGYLKLLFSPDQKDRTFSSNLYGYWIGQIKRPAPYHAQLGTHQFIFSNGKKVPIRHIQGPFITVHENQSYRYRISGNLKIEYGLWSWQKGIVLEITSID